MPRTYSLTSPTDQTSTQEGASLRKIYKLSLAISRFKNCYSLGTEPAKTPWSLLGPPVDNEIKSASEKLQAIQQAFDICGRPIQELKTGFWGGACVSLTKHLTQSTRSNLRRLYIECGPSSRSGEKNLSLDLPSLVYLNLKQVPNHDLGFLKSQRGFPSLKELEINLSSSYDAQLTHLADIIMRQPALEIVRISLLYSSASACSSFAKFCHIFKQLKVFHLKFDELNYSAGGNQTSVEFDCTDAEDLDRLASFSRTRPFASNFASDGPDVLENFDFDSFLHNTGNNDGDGGFGNMNSMTNSDNDGIQHDDGVQDDDGIQDDGGIEDPLSGDLEKGAKTSQATINQPS
ncbi:hypothetical protein E2P81_ATG00646 [Venturia nashicola]|nr:hypothetical protein E2P81_ATG00646 [Venturia nashicola]